MLLNTEYITPVELTGYARAALADLTVNQFTLSRWLPNRQIDDLMYRFTRGGDGLTEAATYRSYDTESPIGARPGISRVTGELPPISRKIRLGEYDRLRQRRADSAVRDAILDDATRMVRAVAARLEMARGEALYTGKVSLNENGVIATVDFGRKAGHTVTASTPWSTTATATPVADLLSWQQTYTDDNGEPPGVILTSQKVVGYLLRNTDIRGLLAANGVTPSIATRTGLASILQAYGLPPIETYDAQVKVNGSATRVIPDDRVLLLPAPGPATDLGATLLGTTAESMEPEYGLDNEADQPGIVAGAYSTKDPVAVWTKAAAIGLPVLVNPDLTFCADVA
jgi:Phage major capsid protein E